MSEQLQRNVFDPRANWVIVLMAVAMTASFAVWVFSWGAKITVLEVQAAQQQKTDDRQDKTAEANLNKLRSDISEINQKMDLLIGYKRQ